MKVEDLFSKETAERFKQHKESYEDRETLISVAVKTLSRSVNYSCRNCYMDVFAELLNMYTHNRELFDERTKEKRYIFRRGLCMPISFGSQRMIVYQNCTEELAVEFLSINLDNIQYFESYPTEWKDDVAAYLAKQSSDANPVQEERTPAEMDVISTMRQMLAEGATKKGVKDHFMKFEKIGDVKVTNRFIDSLMKEASVSPTQEDGKEKIDVIDPATGEETKE